METHIKDFARDIQAVFHLQVLRLECNLNISHKRAHRIVREAFTFIGTGYHFEKGKELANEVEEIIKDVLREEELYK